MTALVSCNLCVAEYTALQMKQAVAGHGKAAKAQVQEMVKRLLKLPGLPGKLPEFPPVRRLARSRFLRRRSTPPRKSLGERLQTRPCQESRFSCRP